MIEKKRPPQPDPIPEGGLYSKVEINIPPREIKRNIKSRLREYLRAKGVQITDSGFIRCPWHDGDDTPSCKVNDDYAHCFACNEGGDIYQVAAALIGVPCDKEHFREIAADVERTLGLPEWQPPAKPMRSISGFKLSASAVYRSELLKDFAKALEEGDMDRAYYRAHLLFALFMLPEAAR